MHSRRAITTFLVVIVIAVSIIMVLVTRTARPSAALNPPKSENPAPAQSQTLRDPTASLESARNQNLAQLDERFERTISGALLYRPAIRRSAELHKGDDPQEDFYIVRQLFEAYQLIIGSYPVGSENGELTAQLLGDNGRQLSVLDASPDTVSSEGKLLDRWGEPYRFHRLSASEIAIQSKGPDRLLWTEDDLSLDK